MTASLYSRAEGFVSGSSRTGPVTRIARVVQYRQTLKLLVARDLKVRYAGSALDVGLGAAEDRIDQPAHARPSSLAQ